MAKPIALARKLAQLGQKEEARQAYFLALGSAEELDP